ncbi:MAG TPA: hypothetical protein DCQ98_01595, partial [Planctomycetaceae bacterium]|nr:hypothetical protein [Planctomycetaceae bacterium]
PEVRSPVVHSPEVLNPEVLSPEVLSPEALSPEALSPEALSPEARSPVVRKPEVRRPVTEPRTIADRRTRTATVLSPVHRAVRVPPGAAGRGAARRSDRAEESAAVRRSTSFRISTRSATSSGCWPASRWSPS